jgi:hypothetical protein
MANRETYPSSLFPLRGDLRAEAGATTVEVIGLEGTPINFAATVLVNGFMTSLDYVNLVNTALCINYNGDDFLGNRVNGVLI